MMVATSSCWLHGKRSLWASMCISSWGIEKFVRTKRSSVLGDVVGFSSAMVISGGGAVVDELVSCCEGSRNGLLERVPDGS